MSEAGREPQSVRTTARVRLEMGDDGPSITRSDLESEATVEEIDDEEFQRIAQEAKSGCPVSRALGAIEIGLEARRAETGTGA